MPIAEQGYRPYEGKRLATRHNNWVISRMEASRIWASLLVKLVVIVAILFSILKVGYLVAYGLVLTSRVEDITDLESIDRVNEQLLEILSIDEILDDIDGQLVFAIVLALAWGSGAIANDIRTRSLQFYFAKPVTERSYLTGKITPLAIFCFVLISFPGILDCIVEGVLLKNQGMMAGRFALVLPTMLYSAIVALFFSIIAVGLSSLSKNRLLTFTYLATFFFVPLAVSNIVDLVTQGDFQWLYLISPISLVRIMGKAIFRIDDDNAIEWYHALPLIVALSMGSLYASYRNLSKTEVIG